MTSSHDETLKWQTVEAELERLPPADRLPFLALLEQKVRREGRLDYLRVIREYKANRSTPPLRIV
jgi:hypothetical protein